MEKTINQRLKAVRTALKMNQRDFSKSLFLKQGSYCRIEKGGKVNPRIIEVVSSVYNVNKKYLIEGRGDMFSGTPPDVKLDKLNHIFNELNGLFQDYLIIQAKNLLKVQIIQENTSTHKGKKN